VWGAWLLAVLGIALLDTPDGIPELALVMLVGLPLGLICLLALVGRHLRMALVLCAVVGLAAAAISLGSAVASVTILWPRSVQLAPPDMLTTRPSWTIVTTGALREAWIIWLLGAAAFGTGVGIRWVAIGVQALRHGSESESLGT
jgi:hypothetical protein